MQALTVTLLTDFEHPGETEEITVTTCTKDQTRWEMHAAKRDWPSQTKIPTVYATFMAWSALKRANRTELDFEDFANTVEGVQADITEVNPTRTGA